MGFEIDTELLADCRAALSERPGLFWIVGGSGSGKSTVCRALSARFDIPVYDMDARIYGSYHRRFSAVRHPANAAWAAAPNGLKWLLDMSWEEFDAFNRAALPEYCDLLAQDLAAGPASAVLVDGGICNPALLARVIPSRQIVCMSRPGLSSAEIWAEDGDRASMRDEVVRLPSPEASWLRFLEFDELITRTSVEESRESGIAVCVRHGSEPVDAVGDEVAGLLGLG